MDDSSLWKAVYSKDFVMVFLIIAVQIAILLKDFFRYRVHRAEAKLALLDRSTLTSGNIIRVIMKYEILIHIRVPNPYKTDSLIEQIQVFNLSAKKTTHCMDELKKLLNTSFIDLDVSEIEIKRLDIA